MNADEIRSRIHKLAEEISANEEENHLMQDEIDSLYAELDNNIIGEQSWTQK